MSELGEKQAGNTATRGKHGLGPTVRAKSRSTRPLSSPCAARLPVPAWPGGVVQLGLLGCYESSPARSRARHAQRPPNQGRARWRSRHAATRAQRAAHPSAGSGDLRGWGVTASSRRQPGEGRGRQRLRDGMHGRRRGGDWGGEWWRG